MSEQTGPTRNDVPVSESRRIKTADIDGVSCVEHFTHGLVPFLPVLRWLSLQHSDQWAPATRLSGFLTAPAILAAPTGLFVGKGMPKREAEVRPGNLQQREVHITSRIFTMTYDVRWSSDRSSACFGTRFAVSEMVSGTP